MFWPGCSLQWPVPLETGSRAHGPVVVAPGLRARAQQLWPVGGMWGLPGSGIKPVSPALAGGFFTTESPGKSYDIFFFNFQSALTIWQRFRKLCSSGFICMSSIMDIWGH